MAKAAAKKVIKRRKERKNVEKGAVQIGRASCRERVLTSV